MPAVISRAELFAARPRYIDYHDPDLEKVLRFRAMSAGHQEELKRLQDEANGPPGHLRARMVIYSLVDEHCAYLLSLDDIEDIEKLPGEQLNRWVEQVMSISGMSPDEEKATGEVSPETSGGASPSALPLLSGARGAN